MNRAHIDIETLSTRTNAMVLSIGIAVVNDENGLLYSNVFYPDLGSQGGRHIDPRTVQWWMGQGEQARKLAFVEQAQQRFFRGILTSMDRFFKIHTVEEVWGNGPVMDIAILESLAEDQDCRDVIPWGFRQVRDLRTLRMLAPTVKRIEPMVAHSAQHDAIAQGLWAREMIKWLKKGA